MPTLLLGPLVRSVEATSAAVWVETDTACQVRITAGDVEAVAPTFAVHGHHYALVIVDGLPTGEATPYQVHLDETGVWPLPDSPFPPSVLATMDPEKPLRLAFGSCRTSVPHDAEGNATHGVDALRAYALRMAGLSRSDQDPEGQQVRWPDMVLFLGDQVYADETTEPMREFIASRRSLDEPPWDELKDYDEYAHLYKIAWSDPAIRWLLSTLPSAMIFDDHDVRDDWNTSLTWRRQMEATSWWHERIVSGLASYWVYQHLATSPPPPAPRMRCGSGSRPRTVPASSTSGRSWTPSPTGSTRTPPPTASATCATSAPRRGSSSSTAGPRGCSSRDGARSSTTSRWPGWTSS